MSNFPNCAICKNPNIRKLVELGYSVKMTSADIANAFGGIPSSAIIGRHMAQHFIEGNYPVEDTRTTKDRVDELMRRMLDEVEVRIRHAEEWAAEAKALGNPLAQTSDVFDILSPKNQAAIATILKMQDQQDKRLAKKATVAVDLMRIMGGAPPPSHLISDGLTIEGEVTEPDE